MLLIVIRRMMRIGDVFVVAMATNGNEKVFGRSNINLPESLTKFPIFVFFVDYYSIDPLINRVKEPQTTTNETEIILEMEIKLPKNLPRILVSLSLWIGFCSSCLLAYLPQAILSSL